MIEESKGLHGIRVLLVPNQPFPRLTGGGRQAQKVVHQLGRQVSAIWWTDVTLFPEARRTGATVLKYRRSYRGRWTEFVGLALTFLRYTAAYDVVHVLALRQPGLAAALVALLSRKGLVIKIGNQGEAGSGHRFVRWLKTVVLRKADVVSVPSRAILEEVTRILGAEHAAKVRVIRNGVSISRQLGGRPAQVGGGRGTVRRVVFVGNVCHRKGVHILVDAFRRLTDADVVLSLVGHFEGRWGEIEPEYVQGVIDNAKQDRRIRLEGPTSSPEEWLLDANVLVLPSYAEGLPNILLEAMALGTPVIASDIAPNVEVLQGGEFGLLFRTGDVEDLARKLEYGLRNVSDMESIARRARRQIELQFNIVDTAQNTLAAYNEARSSS